MAAFVKGKLKAAREAIGKKDFDTALSASREVLSFESNNYNALVFCGLALFELRKDAECEETYLKATAQAPEQLLAWQGLLKLYERKGDHKKTLEVLETLLKHHSKSDDTTKTAETIQKILALQRENGTRLQIVAALELFLPSSPYYSLLSTLPPPDLTQPTATTTFVAQSAIHNSLPLIEEIVELIEKEEESEISKEVDRRRMRLGAGRPEDIKNEVGCSIWGASKLPSMYDEIIGHPSTSDEMRRATESKLFRYRLRYQKALPPNDAKKGAVRAQVEEMMRGMVLLKIADDLVWVEWFETKDAARISDYNLQELRQFIHLFPTHPLSRSIEGYFQCSSIPVKDEVGDEEDESEEPEVDYDTAFQNVLEGYNEMPNLVLSHRLLVDLYLREADYPNTIKTAEAGLREVRRVEKETGRGIQLTMIAFQEAMSTSLVHHFPPKHHPRALGVIEQVLASQPENVACLMARAYTLRYAEKYPAAEAIFSQVAKLIQQEQEEAKVDKLLYLEAKEEEAWCQSLSGDYESTVIGLKGVIDELDGFEDQPRRQAQAWWRLGRTFWDQNSEGSRGQAYSHFITALKRDSTFAPAFTSLGIHYLEQASPSDPLRASKCFQKAVELDSREGEAARRLAEGFADEREWDLVEVVARRTIEGEGGAEGDVTTNVSNAARYKPVNAWAWKAIGIVELNRSTFQPAIISLQIALRADESDYKTWIRLGEAYSRSGRPAAALKALNHAHGLAPDDWTCQFFTAEVYRQMGLYDMAISLLEHILALEQTKDEVGVIVSLAESHLALGRAQFISSFVSRAELSWASAIHVSCRMLETTTGFKRIAWKVVADSLLALSRLTTLSQAPAIAEVVELLLPHFSSLPQSSSSKVGGIRPWSRVVEALREDVRGSNVGWLAVAAYHIRVELCSDDDELESATLYDYATSLHALSSRCLPSELDQLRVGAIDALKRALIHESGNDMYWNALGTITMSSNPKIAQHSLIKAIELDGKNAVYWTNLGLFYLDQGDPELANHALYKAQVLDPEYALAWVGQAFVALSNGHLNEAKAVLAHAITLPLPVARAEYEYGSSVLHDFGSPPHAGALNHPEHLVTAYFALRRYCAELGEDATGLNIFALLCERLGQLELANELLGQAIVLLERAYEVSEDAETERRYAIANVNIGRVRLALGCYDAAKEAFDVVLGLLSSEAEEEGGDNTQYARTDKAHPALLRVQAHFGRGMALFKQGELEEALASFESSAEAVHEGLPDVKSHVSILTAQTLWAIGGEEAQDTARDQLLESITENSGNLGAITTLAAIGILSDSEDLVQASLADILATSVEQREELDPNGDVDRLLALNFLHLVIFCLRRLLLFTYGNSSPCLGSSGSSSRDTAKRIRAGR
ncbi:hypothetical protein DL93DRAFT_2205831 [Clavulina sp. PMI_390]|nr:hypothetical protein DL93DRAFT_2205831 [Clavulina sp. PMI_390]